MVLGLDISTACVGYSLFSDEGKLIEASYVKFRDKISKFQKLKDFIEATKYFDSMPEKIKYIAIEEPLKKFAGKFSNAGTISTLNQFNGMISSYVFLKYNIEPVFFNVNAARSAVFPDLNSTKEKDEKIKFAVWKKVSELEPLINWKYGKNSQKLLTENFDTSDSYVIGMALLLLLEKQGVVNNEINEE